MSHDVQKGTVSINEEICIELLAEYNNEYLRGRLMSGGVVPVGFRENIEHSAMFNLNMTIAWSYMWSSTRSV